MSLVEWAWLTIALLLFVWTSIDVWSRRHHIMPHASHLHHHEGVELSRHEERGHTVIVFECRHCRLRFKGEM